MTNIKTIYTNVPTNSEKKIFVTPYSSKNVRKIITGENRSTEKNMQINGRNRIMNRQLLDIKTGENLCQLENIEEVNMTSEYQIDYGRDEHGNILTRCIHDPTYEFTFNANKPIDTEEFYKILGIDMANMPDGYDIKCTKFVQVRKHKKKRINKKWLKRYGYKQVNVKCKGWIIRLDTDGNAKFVKDGNTL